MADIFDRLATETERPPAQQSDIFDKLASEPDSPKGDIFDRLATEATPSWEPAKVEQPTLKPWGNEGEGGSTTDQSQWTGPEPTRDAPLIRGAKQFANTLIPQSIKYFMASGKMLDRASKTDPALANIYAKIDRKEPLSDDEKVVKAQKENKLLASLQYDEGAVQEFAPESLKVDAPIGIGEKLTDVGAGLAGFLTHLLVAKKLVPPGTLISPKIANAVAFEIAGQTEGQPGGHGLALGSVLNQTARIPSTVGRVAVEAGLFGGLTAAEGGNLEDVLISAGIPVALAGVHSAMSWDGFSKQYPKFDLAVSKRVETERDLSHAQAREEVLTAAKAYKANPDDPEAQNEWRRVTAKYGGYGSLKEEAAPPLTPDQQATVKTNLAELQAQADASKPPAPLTPEQKGEVQKNLAELQTEVTPAPPAETPLPLPTTVTERETTPPPTQPTPEAIQKTTAEAQGRIAPAPEPTGAGAQPPAPAPVAEKQQWSISGRNADLDEHAKRMGLDGINTKEKQTMRGWLGESKRLGIPEKSMDLAIEIIAGGRPMPETPLEVVQAGMEYRLGELSLEYKKLESRKQATSDPAEKMSLSAEQTQIREQFGLVQKGQRMIGTTAGRTLVGRKMTLDEDLELLPIINQAQENRGPKGRTMTEQEKQQYAKMVEDRDAAIKERDEMRTKVAEMEAFAKVKDGGKRRTGRKMPEARTAERKALTDQIRVLLKAGCY